MTGPRSWWRYAKARSEDHRAARQAKRQQAQPAHLPGILRGPRQVALVLLAAILIAASLTSLAESYRGLYDWASGHGLSGIWAAVWPLQVDVFIVAGELALFVALLDAWRRRDRAAAWTVTLAGLGESVAGNVGHVAAYAHGHAVAHLLSNRVTAAIPPLAAAAALAVGLGVLKRIVRRHRGPLRTVAADVQSAAAEALRATTAAGNPLSDRQLGLRFGLARPDVVKVRELVAAEFPAQASLNGQGGAS